MAGRGARDETIIIWGRRQLWGRQENFYKKTKKSRNPSRWTMTTQINPQKQKKTVSRCSLSYCMPIKISSTKSSSLQIYVSLYMNSSYLGEAAHLCRHNSTLSATSVRPIDSFAQAFNGSRKLPLVEVYGLDKTAAMINRLFSSILT